MSEIPANVPEGTVTDMAQLETNEPVGESTEVETESVVGESSASPAESSGESGEKLFDGKTAEQVYESYKALQTEFGTRNEANKATSDWLSRYGGQEQVEQWLTFMNTDEGMQNYIRERNQEQVFGQPQEEITDEQRQAQDIVKGIVQRELEAFKNSQVDPIANSYKAKLLEENMKTMDTKYGAEWRNEQTQMLDLAKRLPESIQDNPSFEDINDLYILSLSRSGKLDEMAVARYEKTLKEQKAKSQEQPISSVGKPAAKKASTILEAFNQAKTTESQG